MNPIEQLFETLSSKLDIYESFLNEGASEPEIKEIEKATGLSVPELLLQLLQKYNGEKKTLGFLGLRFLSCSEIIAQWKLLDQISSQPDFNEGERLYFQPELLTAKSFFSNKRLPFAHDGSGQLLCIDYIPGEKGNEGQIIYLPTAEPEPMSVIASSFDSFIQFIIKALQSGSLALYDDRDDYEDDEQHFAEIYFYKQWKQDWTDIAVEYK
ncbi:MAG: transcriptional regulator [Thalassobius sp.]|nr:transcriptional regulator [Thalassovita sp.]